MQRTQMFKLALAAAGTGIFAISAHASPTVTQAPYQNTAFAVSSTDLINGLLPTAISGTQDQESLNSDTTGAALTDGTFGPANPYVVGGSSSMTIMNNGASVTYALPSTSTITGINTFSAWQDGGRSQQGYTVSISSDGILYTQIASVSGLAVDPYPNGRSPSDDEVSITDTTGTLASGVNYIQFDFPSEENGYVGYTELDVIGSSTPEPASLGIVAFAGLALLARRRRSF